MDSDRIFHLASMLRGITEPLLALLAARGDTNGVWLQWHGGNAVTQYLEHTAAVTGTGVTWTVFHTNLPPTAITNEHTHVAPAATSLFYRVRAVR